MSVIPKRSRYLGVFAVDPTPTEAGMWWYNSTERRIRFFDGLRIVPVPKLSSGTATLVVNVAGDYGVSVSINNATGIDYVLSILLGTNPTTSITHVQHVVAFGNVVGMTLTGVARGTTISIEVVASVYG